MVITTSSRGLVHSALFVLFVVTVGFWGGHRAVVRVFAAAELEVRPYVMHLSDYTVVDGTPTLTMTEIESRRRDGAIHKVETPAGQQGGPAVFRRVDFPDGRTAMIVDSVRAKSTGYLPRSQVAARNAETTSPPPGCVHAGEVADGETSLLGQPAVRVIMQPGPDAVTRAIVTRLIAFNCIPTETVLQHRAAVSDNWQTTGEVRVTAFEEVDPDAALFTNWSDYEEMKPSDIKRRIAQKAGVSPQQCPKCFEDDASDANYLKRQKPL